jgi:uncharacterized protein YbcI
MTETESVPSSPKKDIGRGVVQIAKEHIGRGPTKVRVTIADDTVMVIYEDSLTPAEKKLVDGGDTDFVRLMRRKFQDAVRADVTALVEQVLGRRARTFLSDHDVVHDVGLEVILLEDAVEPAEVPQTG